MKRERVKLGERRRQDLRNEAFVRKCCNTHLREPHLDGCLRPVSRCADKVGYASRDKAIEVAATLVPVLGRMTQYRCDGCGAWHIGHPKTAAEGLEA